jgi:hypothetical protein
MRHKIREEEIKNNTKIQAIADFLQKVLTRQQQQDVYESLPSTSSSVFYETPKKKQNSNR